MLKTQAPALVVREEECQLWDPGFEFQKGGAGESGETVNRWDGNRKAAPGNLVYRALPSLALPCHALPHL